MRNSSRGENRNKMLKVRMSGRTQNAFLMKNHLRKLGWPARSRQKTNAIRRWCLNPTNFMCTGVAKVMTAVALIEAITIIGLLIVFSGVRGLRVKVVPQPVVSGTSVQGTDPLRLAIQYRSRDDMFEQLASRYADWIREPNRHTNDKSYLSSCALLRETNYVRILIKHGANVEETVKWLEANDLTDRVTWIRELASQVNKVKQQ